MQATFPTIGSVWRHYKGDKYVVVGFAFDEDGDCNVLYQKVHGKEDLTFCQKISRFMQHLDVEQFEVLTTVKCARFKPETNNAAGKKRNPRRQRQVRTLA